MANPSHRPPCPEGNPLTSGALEGRDREESTDPPIDALTAWTDTQDRSLSLNERVHAEAQDDHIVFSNRPADMATQMVDRLWTSLGTWPSSVDGNEFLPRAGTSFSKAATSANAGPAPPSSVGYTTAGPNGGQASASADTNTVHSDNNTSTPSLVNETTIDSSSLCTSVVSAEIKTNTAINRQGPPFQDQESPIVVVKLPCVFSCLNCVKEFDQVELWKMHCNSHLRQRPPPELVSCKLCRPHSEYSWDAYLDHFATHHDQRNPGSGGYDARLLRCLFENELISNTEYYHIINHGNTAVPIGIYAETYNRMKERRSMNRRNFGGRLV